MDLLFDLGYGEKGNWHLAYLARYVLWWTGLPGFRYVWNMCFFRRDCRSSRFHLVLFLPVTVLGDFVVSISGLVYFLAMCFFFTSRCRLGSVLWEARHGVVASRDCGWAKRWRGLGKTICSCTLLVCATWIYGCFGRPGQIFHGECQVFPEITPPRVVLQCCHPEDACLLMSPEDQKQPSW